MVTKYHSLGTFEMAVALQDGIFSRMLLLAAAAAAALVSLPTRRAIVAAAAAGMLNGHSPT